MHAADTLSPDKNDVLILPSAVTIDTIESLFNQFREINFAPPAFTLDASKTEVITTPGIQLLLALSKGLSERGIDLVITHVQPAFAQAFASLGLAELLTKWAAK